MRVLYILPVYDMLPLTGCQFNLPLLQHAVSIPHKKDDTDSEDQPCFSNSSNLLMVRHVVLLGSGSCQTLRC